MNTMKAAFLSILLCLSNAVSAAEVEVGGNYTTEVSARNVTTVALGRDVKALTNLAGIQGGARVGGNYTAKVSARNVTTVALGRSATACTNLGGIQASC